jgi:hypothetical protein
MMERAKQRKEKLILFCHWPLLNMWTPDFESSLLWNAKEVLDMLDPGGMLSSLRHLLFLLSRSSSIILISSVILFLFF